MPEEISSKKRLWTEEFSVQSAEDKFVLRRQFTKFLVLTSCGMLAGNVWIWVRSLMRRAAPQYPELPVALASAIPVGGVALFNYPGPDDNCILVHTARQPICRVQPEMHAFILRGLLFQRAQPVRVSVPRRILQHRGWACIARSAAASTAEGGTGAARRSVGRHSLVER